MKRVLSFLMVLLLVVGLVPMQAKAAGSDLYNVTINITGKGTASASPATAAAGETVTIDFEADEISGHEYKECTVHFPDGSVIYLDYWDREFTMPEGNVTVNVKFGPVGDGDDWEGETEAYVSYTYYTTAGSFLGVDMATVTPGSRYQFVTLDGYVIDHVQAQNTYGATIEVDANHGVIVPEGGVAAVIWLKQGGGNEPQPVQPVEYNITVVAPENGNVSTDVSKAKKDDTITVTATPAANYTLDKITVTTADGNEVNVANGQFIMPASDVTVTATFKVKQMVKVTFDANSGSCDTSALDVESGSTLSRIPTATREDFSFAGWFTSSGKKVTASTVFTQNTTVYARWAAHTTNPSDNAYTGDINMSNQDVVDMLLTEEDLAKGLDAKVYLEIEERSATTVPAGDYVAITAKAGDDEIAAYMDIQLLKEFSDGTRVNITNTNNKYVPITLKLTDAMIPDNAVADSFYIIYHHVENGSTVTAKLSANFNPSTKILSFSANKFSTYALAYTTYDVSFDANGGSGTMESHTVPAGSNFTLPTSSFNAPSGKQFSHWEVNGERKNPADTIVISGNTTVTAVWKSIGGTLDNVPKAGDIPGLNMVTMLIMFSAAALAGIAIYDKKRTR